MELFLQVTRTSQSIRVQIEEENLSQIQIHTFGIMYRFSKFTSIEIFLISKYLLEPSSVEMHKHLSDISSWYGLKIMYYKIVTYPG